MLEFLRKTALVAAGAVVGTAMMAGSAYAADKSVNIGWTAWSDAEAVTKIAKRILEDEMGYEVKLTMADIGIQYQGIASGDLDFMLMSWLPTTHQNYWKEKGLDVVNLGPLYTRARLGWIVPAYVPESEVKTIADLTKDSVREKLSGKIQGIDPGAGLMQASEKAMTEYDLDGYELVSASGAAMTAALGRAVRRDEWIVITGWSPHWKFAKWDLRYLEDPKGVLGGLERVHALARQGLYQDHPEVAEFLTRMYFPLEDLQAVMFEASESSYEEAVDNWIKNNTKRIDYWVTGNIAE